MRFMMGFPKKILKLSMSSWIFHESSSYCSIPNHLRTPLRDVSRNLSPGMASSPTVASELKSRTPQPRLQRKVGVELQLDLDDFNKIRALHGDFTIQTEDFIGFTCNRW